MVSTAIDINIPEIKSTKRNKSNRYLTSDNISDILHSYVKGMTVNAIKDIYGCSWNVINNIISKNSVRIGEIRNQRLIQQEKDFKFKLSDLKHNIIDNTTIDDITEASLSQKTGSMADIEKIQALNDGRSTENIAISVNVSKDNLINYIKNGIIDEKH